MSNLKTIYGRPWNSYSSPCICCGMTYVNSKTPPKTFGASKGLRVLAGKHGVERDFRQGNKLTSLTHVETKNGILTVIARTIDK